MAGAGKQGDDSGNRYKKMAPRNKRRASLGVHVNAWDSDAKTFFAQKDSRYLRDLSSRLPLALRSFLGCEVFGRSERWKMLRRAKLFLSRRSFDSLDERYLPALYGNRRDISTVLDCFPALKYSYSAPLPARVFARNRGLSDKMPLGSVCLFDLCSSPNGSSKKARVSELSRSGSIRLDPMDAPRQLFLYRLRIQKCISWSYSVGLVPIMMTLTVFHRWHSLRGLLNVLKRAWNYFFTGTRAAVERSQRMGLRGYIRRAEETINNGSRESGYNSGWHPHYHVILFVPRDKLSVVSSMEKELREAWFVAVNRYFVEEFGEEIDSSYASSFKRHGLFFSRCHEGQSEDSSFDHLTNSQTIIRPSSTTSTESSSDIPDEPSTDVYSMTDGDEAVDAGEGAGGGNTPSARAATTRSPESPLTESDASEDDDEDEDEDEAPLRQVDDGEYMAKTIGCDSNSTYGGDKEMSFYSKDSRVPFDLLLEDTAENNDLWVEYAIATKGVRSFIFSRGLEDRVKKYFEAHPDRNPIKDFVKSDKVVAQLDSRLYHLLYQNFKVDEMLFAAAKGYDALCSWFKDFYLEVGLSEEDIIEDIMPYLPNSHSYFTNKIDPCDTILEILTSRAASSTTTDTSSSAASMTSTTSTESSSDIPDEPSTDVYSMTDGDEAVDAGEGAGGGNTPSARAATTRSSDTPSPEIDADEEEDENESNESPLLQVDDETFSDSQSDESLSAAPVDESLSAVTEPQSELCDSDVSESVSLEPLVAEDSSSAPSSSSSDEKESPPSVALTREQIMIEVLRNACNELLDAGKSINLNDVQALLSISRIKRTSAVQLCAELRKELGEEQAEDDPRSKRAELSAVEAAYSDSFVSDAADSQKGVYYKGEVLYTDSFSIEARIDSVSKSKWYPPWYRSYLASVKAQRDAGVTEEKPTDTS